MGKVAQEQAEKEVKCWLDYKKVNELKREQNKDSLDTLVGNIREGILTIAEDFTITHALQFPVGENNAITTLKYRPRAHAKLFHAALKGVKGTDVDARLVAYAATLSDQPKAIIESLDSEDYSIALSVAVFFM